MFWRKENKNVSLLDLLDKYMEYGKARGWTDASVIRIMQKLSEFDVFYSSKENCLSQLTHDKLDEYVVWLKDRGLADSTTRAYLCCLSTFYVWAHRRKHLSINPMTDYQKPRVDVTKKPAHDPFILREKLLAACLNSRDKLIIEFLFHTVCRCKGAASAKYENWDKERGIITLSEKGKVYDVKPVSNELAVILAEHEKLGYPYVLWDYLNPTKGLKPQSISQFVKAVAKRAGLKVSAHSFRHSLATWYAENVGIYAAKEMLGHADIKMTASRYANSNIGYRLELANMLDRPAVDSKEETLENLSLKLEIAELKKQLKEIKTSGANKSE